MVILVRRVASFWRPPLRRVAYYGEHTRNLRHLSHLVGLRLVEEVWFKAAYWFDVSWSDKDSITGPSKPEVKSPR